MSAVCYDGETLAADRMASVVKKNGSRKVTSLKQHKIIVDFSTTVFDGERVYAAGRAGRLQVSEALIKILSRSRDLATRLDKVGDQLRKMVPEEKMHGASLIILTSGHVHVLRVNKHYKVVWRKESRDKKIAIGSGKVLAVFMMQHFGLSAIDVVAAMELQHDSCGGGVCYTTRIKSNSHEPIGIRRARDKKGVHQDLLLRVVTTAGAKYTQLAR